MYCLNPCFDRNRGSVDGVGDSRLTNNHLVHALDPLVVAVEVRISDLDSSYVLARILASSDCVVGVHVDCCDVGVRTDCRDV